MAKHLPISLPFLLGATKRAHPAIVAYPAEMPHLMAGSIFKTRNPCKHWPKRVLAGILSSMFLDKQVHRPGYPAVTFTSVIVSLPKMSTTLTAIKGQAQIFLDRLFQSFGQSGSLNEAGQMD